MSPHFRLSEVVVPVYFAHVNCIITAGPTFEPLDEVRRLTNFSSGKLGSQLADFLAAQGHRVLGVELSPLAVEQFFAEHRLAPHVHESRYGRHYQAGNIELICGDAFGLDAEALADCVAV